MLDEVGDSAEREGLVRPVKGTEYDLYASPAPKKCALDGAPVTVDRSGDGEPLESVDGRVQYPWAGVFEAGKDGKAVLTCDSSSPTLFVTARETNAFNLLLLPSLALFLGSGFWFGWARKRRGSSGYTAKHRPEPPAAGQKARALTRDAAMRHRAVDFIHGTLVAAPDPAEARAALTASLASDLLIRETTDDGWFVEASPTVRIFVSKDDLRSESSAAVIRCAAAKLDLDRRALTTMGF